MTFPSDTETIERFHSDEDVLRAMLTFLKNAKSVNICGDSASVSRTIEVKLITKYYKALKGRNVNVRWVTEITKDNVRYCKALTEYVELHHLDGIKGNFGVSDEAYITTSPPATTAQDKTEHGAELLYCRAKSIIDQNKKVFESLWNMSISAQVRIKEIEEGAIQPKIKTVENSKEILQGNIELIKRSKQYSVCSTSEQLISVENYSNDVFREIIELHKYGKHAGVRWLTKIEVNGDSKRLEAIKALMKLGVQIRHIQSTPTISFGLSETEIAVSIGNSQEGSSKPRAIFNSEPAIVEHFAAIFEELWNSGIDASEIIEDMEGEQKMFIDIIHNPVEIQKRYHALVASARHEILLFLPTATAYKREEKIGIFESLEQAVDRGANIRILLPTDREIEEKIQHKIKLKRGFEIRKIKTAITAQARSKILIADNSTYLTIELRDNSKETFVEAVGSAIISNSKSTVLSYLTMFDSLWRQAELYEKLEAQDRMQKEFINIAAHELRTPTQAILGYSELLQNESGLQAGDMLKSLTRNAYRLQSLINDILDVARIEAGTLILERENTNLTDLINAAIGDSKNQVKLSGRSIKISYSQNQMQGNEEKKNLFAKVDKDRILQVISNLLGNALKFTKEGNIAVITEKTDNEILVKVKDSGTGIDEEIFPKLFEKFASKSEKGTGLGLFISKNIIEAHGGRIWAENNPNERGATFGFTIRL
ncbi:MAG: ATP-binding protein [Nitrososphaera sp.]